MYYQSYVFFNAGIDVKPFNFACLFNFLKACVKQHGLSGINVIGCEVHAFISLYNDENSTFCFKPLEQL